MARLNTRAPSSTPARALSGLQDRTPQTTRETTVASSAYSALSPSSSDKENQTIAPTSNAKGRMGPPAAVPTPNPGSAGSRSTKRRRMSNEDTDTPPGGAVSTQSRYYDPSQDEGERREVKRQSRALEREFNENRDDYLRSDNVGLHRTIKQANTIFESVKQTADATLDSRLMVNVSDLTYKKSALLVLGDTSTGVDVDDFVSKCIAFMRQAPARARRDDEEDDEAPTSTSRRRRRSSRNEEDEDDDTADQLDWAYLGSQACFPRNLRPPVPGFLLGPLSVQKKVRAQTQRRARQQRDTGGREVRPEALTKDDIESNENNTVTVICTKVRNVLERHVQTGMAALEQYDDPDSEEFHAALKAARLTTTGGPSLFDFVINPNSFSQTVENLFYVSFLIKEGSVGVSLDNDGLPTLSPAEAPQAAQRGQSRQRGSTRHQAVFSIDYSTWRKLVEAFDIQEPLIPHRNEDQGSTQVGNRGWYG